MNDPLNSFRPANWRWQHAIQLVEHAARSFQHCTDSAIRSAKRFWRSWKACREDRDRGILASRMPAMFGAFSIYSDPEGVTRSAVEARVLASEMPDAISKKSGIDPTVIRLYEHIFFDVRDRLACRDFILNRVIGTRLREGTWSYDVVWKFFGYVGGEFVLDELMDTYGTSPQPKAPEGVAAFLAEVAKTAIRNQTTVAARTLKNNDQRTTGALITPIIRPTRDKEDGDDQAQVLQAHVEAMLKEIPWLVGTTAESKLPPQVAECDEYAAELRTDELLYLGTEQELRDLSAIKEMKMPPARASAASPFGDNKGTV